jgi:hypothetical protein
VNRIIYASENGYTGMLYGRSDYSVYDRDGHEVLHTGERAIETLDELAEQVESFPDFLNALEENEAEYAEEFEEERQGYK